MPASLELQILAWLTHVYTVVGFPGVALAMAIESAFIPFPSEVVMPLAGWLLVEAKGGGFAQLLLLSGFGAFGSLLGSLFLYGLGAKGGRPVLERYGRYLFITSWDLEASNRWFAKHGKWAVCLGRLVPVVRSLVSFPAGIARMNLLRFSLYSFVGSYIWSFALAYAGYLLGERWESLWAYIRPFNIPHDGARNPGCSRLPLVALPAVPA